MPGVCGNSHTSKVTSTYLGSTVQNNNLIVAPDGCKI